MSKLVDIVNELEIVRDKVKNQHPDLTAGETRMLTAKENDNG